MEINNRIRISVTLTLSLVVTLLKTNTVSNLKPYTRTSTKLETNEDTLRSRLKEESDTLNKILTPIEKDSTTKDQSNITIGRQLGRHKATWYQTEGTRVHRPYPTAAYNFAPRGTLLHITNTINNKSCTVEVTDRMGNRKSNHIDLSHSAFGMIADHSTGIINVIVKTLD